MCFKILGFWVKSKISVSHSVVIPFNNMVRKTIYTKAKKNAWVECFNQQGAISENSYL